MATKSKVARLEAEIEKSRFEGNWSKTVDLARQLSSRSSAQESLIYLINGESRLERFLVDNIPLEINVNKAKTNLAEASKCFNDCLKKGAQGGIKLEAKLMQAKLEYVLTEYASALKKYDDINLDQLSDDGTSNRRLKLIAEAFAIKGFCLEKLPLTSSSKFKATERDDAVLACFLRSGDISLAQLQANLEKGKGTPTSVTLPGWNAADNDSAGLGAFVEMAIQRSPILYIRNGELSKGVDRFRDLLRAVETRSIQGLRQILARQLAEVLLRGICGSTYIPVKSVADSPRKYSGNNLFVPKDQDEETLLLLLIAESMATREAVLSRSSEHERARQQTFDNTTAVYDLLTCALVRRAQYSMLSDTFERAMKFSFDEFHIWYQFALSLICSEKYSRGYLVLQNCITLNPTHLTAHLHAAKVCLENLHLYEEGVGYAKKAIELGEDNAVAARAYIILGVGYSLLAGDAKLRNKRREFHIQAKSAFFRAVHLDKDDHLAHFHLALQLGVLRQLPEALNHVRQALRLNNCHCQSLHLLALLLSAQKQHAQALILIEEALNEYPDDFHLLMTRCKLIEILQGAEDALPTCKRMLQLWKNIYEAALESEQRGTGLIDKVTSDQRSLVQLHLTNLSDRDSGSVRAESIAASRVEHALSEVASSINSNLQPSRQGPNYSWVLQAHIWLLMAELYLKLERLEEAQACINEAGTVFPVSYMVYHMTGQLHEKKGDLYEAKNYYENAVAINPTHVRSLQQLGMLLHQLGNNVLAEQILRDAVRADPTSCISWQNLGQVLSVLEDHTAAIECLCTAGELEATNPVMPFSFIPKTLQF